MKGKWQKNITVIFTLRQTSKDQGDLQGRKQVPVTDGRITDNLYFKLNQYSHIAWNTKSARDTNNSNNDTDKQGHTDVWCAQIYLNKRINREALIKKYWILLDT